MSSVKSLQASAPPIKVLLIEDNDGDAMVVQEVLRYAPVKFEVVVAARLSDGFKLLESEPIDVVITDLTLPDSRGIDTFRQLLAHPSPAPIIVMSGLDDETLALQTVEEGAQDYLVKGQFSGALLVRAVRYAVQRAASERALAAERTLLRSVIDNLPDSIYVKQLDGHYLLGNLAHSKQLGLESVEAVVGHTSHDFFAPDVAERFAQDDHKVMESGTPIINRHESFQDDNGNVKWLSTTKVPMRDHAGKIVGLVGIGRDITARKLAEEKLSRYAEELREKNSEMEDDLLMAREVQQAFMPQQFPSFPAGIEPGKSALRFISRYLPTETLGGDFFHVHPISDTQAGIFICDVMGHGVRAALVTAIQRALVEELHPFAGRPGEFLTHMNTALLSILRRTNTPMFASAFYLVADLDAGVLRYANAGHPHALHLRRGQQRVDVLRSGLGRPGPALGVFADVTYHAHETPLAPRDLVLLFTDGLYEVDNLEGEVFDQTLLQKAVETRLQMSDGHLLDELLNEVRSFSATGEFGDDVCILGVEVDRLLEVEETRKK